MDKEAIFSKALTKKTLEERHQFLNKVCAGNNELRQELEALLAAHDDAGSFLNKTPEEFILNSNSESRRDGWDEVAWRELLEPSDTPEYLGKLGSYEIIEKLGQGGFGVVLRAHDSKLHRVVAIKVLAPQLALTGSAVQRFLREARAAAAVSHNHVVAIHHIDDNSRPPMIVMEYIEGQSLQEKIDHTGALDLKSILRIGMQTAGGLAAAHHQGLVHRDVKPANILLENGIERVKLTDFGLARAVDDIGMTKTGQITGTPQYMSPEQAQGQMIDHRTDLFSLGCVMYAMCTGQAAFRAESAIAVMHNVVHQDPRPIREINDDIPDWLCCIIDKLMEKNPDHRFRDASEVEELLSRYLAHLQQPRHLPQPEIPQASVSRNFEESTIELNSVSRVLLGASLACLTYFVVTFLTLSAGWFRHPWSIFVIGSGLLSLPVGLLTMSAFGDLLQRKRYWWVCSAAKTAVVPWNPFLLLMLPWALRAVHTLRHSTVRQVFAEVSKSTYPNSGSTASDNRMIGNSFFCNKYKRTRWVIIFFSIAVTPIWLTIAVLETVAFGPSGEIMWRSPFEQPGVLSEWLMCFQSILLVAICAEYFGRGRSALTAILLLDAIWLLAVGCFIPYFFSLSLVVFGSFWHTVGVILLTMPAMALSFVTYLLSRTVLDTDELGRSSKRDRTGLRQVV